jgi:predicted dehydrogenase
MGVIGSGPIVPFHLDALRDIGFTFSVLVYNTNLDRARQLQINYNISRVTNNIESLDEDNLDCFLLASSAESLGGLISRLWKYKVPILVEKPVWLNSRSFKDATFEVQALTQVGYNRRFYSAVREFKLQISNFSKTFFHVNLPENSWNGNWGPDEFCDNLMKNTVHGIDLMFYLFGSDLKFRHIEINSHNREINAVNCMLSNKDSSGILCITNGIPDSYRVSASEKGARIQLEPLEIFSSYKEIQVIEPSKEHPIRRYIPLSNTSWEMSREDLDYKPGFQAQARAFKSLCETGRLTPESATLLQARQNIEFCETLIDEIRLKII